MTEEVKMVHRSKVIDINYDNVVDVVEKLQAAVASCGDDVRFELGSAYEGDASEVCLTYSSPQTPEEALDKERQVRAITAYRRQQYENLKKEFEGE